MKISFVLGSMGGGGAERVVSILSREYSKQGHDVDILLLLNNKKEYDIEPNINIVDLSGTTDSRLKRLPYWLKSIRRYIKDNRPNVIISFVARINIITQIAASGLNTKMIVSERNDPRLDGRSALIDRLTRYYYPKAHKVVFQTKRAKSFFDELNNGVIIPNPIEVMAYAKEKKKKKIVTAGRLAKQKNHRLLISAFKRVYKLHPDYLLEIYGEGDLRQELERQIVEEGMSSHVKLMGNKKNLHECMADAEMFVLSSDYEGQSNSLLEAMMMGLPCISTDCAGSDEIIQNRVNGLIVPVGDVAALANAMLEYIENKNLLQSVLSKSKQAMVEFNTNKVIEQWNAIVFK